MMTFKQFKEDVLYRKKEDQDKKEEKRLSKLLNKKGKRKIKDSCKNHRNAIVNSILLMLVFTIGGVTILHNIQATITSLEEEITKDYNNFDAEKVIYTKRYIEAKSTSELKDISHNITDQIFDSLDMDKLEDDLNKGIVPKELELIFRNNIIDKCTIDGLDGEKNNIFVCNDKGIMADYSSTRATDSDITRTWEAESTSQANKVLYNNSIRYMLKQDTTYMFVEENNITVDKSHVRLSKMTEADLEGVFKREGLEGLKNYTFLVPVYVFDNNDIFGVFDIVDGHKVQNNKFIIVQRYSLYNYIKAFNIDSKMNKSVYFAFRGIVMFLYIFMIAYICSIICFLLYSVSVLNNAITEQSCKINTNVDLEAITNGKIGEGITGRRAYDKYSAEIIRLIMEEREQEWNDTHNTTPQENS